MPSFTVNLPFDEKSLKTDKNVCRKTSRPSRAAISPLGFQAMTLRAVHCSHFSLIAVPAHGEDPVSLWAYLHGPVSSHENHFLIQVGEGEDLKVPLYPSRGF